MKQTCNYRDISCQSLIQVLGSIDKLCCIDVDVVWLRSVGLLHLVIYSGFAPILTRSQLMAEVWWDVSIQCFHTSKLIARVLAVV
jgi:hypothetical protein